MSRQRLEQQEAIPPNYDSIVAGIRRLGYDDPEVEIGDLVMRSWSCRSDECPGKGHAFGGVVKRTCDACAGSVDVGEESTTPVVQVYLGGNPLRRAVAAICPIRRERVVGEGFEDLVPVGAEHVAICSALMEAFTQACAPEALKAGGQN